MMEGKPRLKHVQRLTERSDKYLTLYVQFLVPDDGRKTPSETCRASYRTV